MEANVKSLQLIKNKTSPQDLPHQRQQHSVTYLWSSNICLYYLLTTNNLICHPNLTTPPVLVREMTNGLKLSCVSKALFEIVSKYGWETTSLLASLPILRNGATTPTGNMRARAASAGRSPFLIYSLTVAQRDSVESCLWGLLSLYIFHCTVFWSLHFMRSRCTGVCMHAFVRTHTHTHTWSLSTIFVLSWCSVTCCFY